jgi:hypothetical protein
METLSKFFFVSNTSFNYRERKTMLLINNPHQPNKEHEEQKK